VRFASATSTDASATANAAFAASSSWGLARFPLARAEVRSKRRAGLHEARLRGLDVGTGALEVGCCLEEGPLEQRRIDQRDDVAGVNERVEVRVELGDRPRHLRADLDRHHGVHRARCLNDVRDVAAFGFRREMLGVAPRPEPVGAEQPNEQDNAQQEDPRAADPHRLYS